MTRVIALAQKASLPVPQTEVLRAVVVLSCALALIFAKNPLPF